MKSVMQHQFSQVPSVEIPRSTFNRTHGYKTTFDSGYLIPFYVDEALPGDSFSCNATIFARLATPVVPIMDNMFLETFFFAVPIRLIWDNWQKFNGERLDPLVDSTDYLVPQMPAPAGGWATGSLGDYFGLPTNVPNLPSVSAFWHRAYNLIWNEWFRDENLQSPMPVPKNDGPDDPTNYIVLRRGKRHDYFTSCLPWPQKGPGVEMPIGGNVPVYGNNYGLHLSDGYDVGYIASSGVSNFDVTQFTMSGNANKGMTAPTAPGYFKNNSVLGVVSKESNLESGLYADLAGATAITINSLRQAFQMQRLLERDARGGTRYTEIVRAHFGVVSPDARLQRPEYLGGSSTRINISPVQQTSSTNSTSPLGTLAAFGIGADSNHGFVKSFTEHCVIIGLVNVRADLTYQQGIPRMFSRQTRWDYYWPALAHLGEQAVLNKEIYAQGDSAIDNKVFGYQERWAEYRYFPSQITGKFRSTDPQSLDVWHLSQKFINCPTLASKFIEDHPPVERVIAVPSQPQFLFDSLIELHCARPMPVYSVPGMLDHF